MTFPIISGGASTTAAMAGGFAVGCALMLILKVLSPPEDPEEDVDLGHDAIQNGNSGGNTALLGGRHQSSRSSLPELALLVQAKEWVPSRRWWTRRHALVSVPLPKTLMLAVNVDALMDGLLVGLSVVAGKRAGVVVAVALAIEMGFLGITYAMALRRQSQLRLVVNVIIPPVILLGGGFMGSVTAHLLQAHPAADVAVIAFAVACMLYLVTEELLLDAHSGEGNVHCWWVDLTYFIGFLAVLIMVRLT